jgi:hypothetical protein
MSLGVKRTEREADFFLPIVPIVRGATPLLPLYNLKMLIGTNFIFSPFFTTLLTNKRRISQKKNLYSSAGDFKH